MKQLPEGWEEKTLGEFFEFQSKSGRKAGQGQDFGKHKFFTSSDVQKKYTDDYDYEGEYLIFGTGGNASIHYCNEKFSTSTDCFVVSVKPVLKAKYVYYFLRGHMHLLESGFKGAGLKHISKKYLSDIKIHYPKSIKVQERVIAILENTEQIMNWRVQSDKATESYTMSVFVEMFGDPVANPNGYPIPLLGDVFSADDAITNGLYLPASKYVHHGGVEMVHMSDAFYEMVNRGALKRVQLTQKELIKYNLTPYDILIARRSLNLEGSAKPCLVPDAQEPLVYESSLIRLRCPKGVVDPVYLYYYLSHPKVRTILVFRYVNGAIIHGINQQGLIKIPLMLPPYHLQRQFSIYYERMRRLKSLQKELKLYTGNLYDIISSRAFKGELDG